MVEDCCKLVGNLELGLSECIISVSTNCNTEIIAACVDELKEGASTLTVNLAGYASDIVWKNCPARAGVSISYVNKYDCENDIVHVIAVNKGQSFKVGPVEELGVELLDELPTTCVALSASSSSGPTSLYTEATQTNGYGLSYSGQPFSFSTSSSASLVKNLGSKLGQNFYLNSFNIEAQPGQLATASYTFVKSL